jgi:hypothetical protein
VVADKAALALEEIDDGQARVGTVANQGPTSYKNLKPKCWPHHQEKTEQDRRAALLDGAVRRLEERAPP